MTETRCVETDCNGVAVSQGRCVGHLDEDALADYVAHLGRDDVLDARGALINQQQCRQLVDLLAVSEFSGDANFLEAHFSGRADFVGAQFRGRADFVGAHFSGDADFTGAHFSGVAYFGLQQFDGMVDFREAHFSGDFVIEKAQLSGFTNFEKAQFDGDAYFEQVQFGYAAFSSARFGRLCVLGPLRADALLLELAVFQGPVAIHAACSTIAAEDIRVRESFTLTGRGCDITMTGARFDAPGRIASSPAQVAFPNPVGEDDDKPPRLLSVEGADLSSVTLAGLDLSACRFIGSYNLDRLHIDGPANFAETPARWRWARRRTLAEEHLWRASYDRRPSGWYPPRCRPGDDDELPAHDRRSSITLAAGGDAAGVQAAYRELRKSFEDAKNEPGAADFYYGEMEMRRMASRAAPSHRFEHALLTTYWAVSGYGLRASRAFLALLLALAVATVLFATVGFGHTQQTVYVPIRSTIPNQPVAYKQTTVPDGKPGVRDAAYYSVQSATSLLREPTSEPLTTIGRITEITLRLLGPLLLGLALLALRGRVKR